MNSILNLKRRRRVKINKKKLKNWAVKILAILIVLALVLTGLVVVFWK